MHRVKKRMDYSSKVYDPTGGPGGGGFEVFYPKDSVAAHQAECKCHVMLFNFFSAVDDMVACCKSQRPVDARDSSGQPWHVDPLCKVRPEARG